VCVADTSVAASQCRTPATPALDALVEILSTTSSGVLPSNVPSAPHRFTSLTIGRRGGQRRRQEEEEAGPPPRFSGSGHTLGSESTSSVSVGEPIAAAPPTLPPVTRTLTFWRDGFSVEDGPLMRYDDPANREILQGIERGRAPLSLMNVQPGQPADVSVFKRMDEDYIPPKKKFVPFSGQGQRLGSLTPGEAIPVAPVAPAPPVAAAASSSQPAAPAVNVDMSAPSTSLQIRLGDGTRLVSRFNHTHTVGDVYAFVNASSIGSRSRSYVLQTTFPNKELKDHAQTIKDAGLINAVVVQKWTS
jgi:UBX domain-containing protein 1